MAAFVLTANLCIWLCVASFGVFVVEEEMGKCVCGRLGGFVYAHAILFSSPCRCKSSLFSWGVFAPGLFPP